MTLLLDRKEVNPDSRDVYCNTPLMCGARGGHEGIMKLLQGRVDAAHCTEANSPLVPPSYISRSSTVGSSIDLWEAFLQC